jgi:NAD(P)-dependent dehydrogenase (short-subunit alcohol dehydrogenase family)
MATKSIFITGAASGMGREGAMFESALADFCAGDSGGGLDMMWNNAGIGETGWFEDVPYDAAMRVVDTNFKAVTACRGSRCTRRLSTPSRG